MSNVKQARKSIAYSTEIVEYTGFNAFIYLMQDKNYLDYKVR